MAVNLIRMDSPVLWKALYAFLPSGLTANFVCMSRQVNIHDAPLPALAEALTFLNIPLVLCTILCLANSLLSQMLITLIPHYSRVFCSPHLHNFIVGLTSSRRDKSSRTEPMAATCLDLIWTGHSASCRRWGHYLLVRFSHRQNTIMVSIWIFSWSRRIKVHPGC